MTNHAECGYTSESIRKTIAAIYYTMGINAAIRQELRLGVNHFIGPSSCQISWESAYRLSLLSILFSITSADWRTSIPPPIKARDYR